MPYRIRFALLLCCVLSLDLVGGHAAAEAPPDDRAVYDVPQMGKIAIDGKADDWGDGGLRVDVLRGRRRVQLPAADFDPRLRLGWTKEGLAVLVVVRDDRVVESSEEAFWTHDSIEMYLAGGWDSKEHYQLLMRPGVDPQAKGFAQHLVDRRFKVSEEVKVEAASSKTDDGYIVEALLPWSSVGVDAKLGAQAAFTIQVNDSDDPAKPKDGRYMAIWYPQGWASNGPGKMHWLRLAKTASPPETTIADIDTFAGSPLVRVSIYSGDAKLVGAKVDARAGARQLIELPLVEQQGRITAAAYVNAEGVDPQAVELTLDGRPVRVELPGAWRVVHLLIAMASAV